MMPPPRMDRISHLEGFEKTEDTALIQLVYVSRLTLSGRINTSIFDEVEAHASQYNEQQSITGILCYGNGQFLQCLEGEKAKVLALQQRICSDKRHKQIKVLSLKPVTQRQFSDWRMRLLFLERWFWSPATKQQALQLAPFLPFAPQSWCADRTEQFMQVIKTFDNAPHLRAAGMTYSALGNMCRHIAAPHQAFLLVQGLLSLLLIVAVMLLWL